MLVTKRDQRSEALNTEKIRNYIDRYSYGLQKDYIDIDSITQRVTRGLYDRVTTKEIANLIAETAATMAVNHHDYSLLAARIAVANLHKVTSDSFSSTIERLYRYVNPRTGNPNPLIAQGIYQIVCDHAEDLDRAIVHERDFEYDYFGFKTLEQAYLMKIDKQTVERPQYMWMRVAVGIHGRDIHAVLKTYELLSKKLFTHATPTLLNAGTPIPQLSSCFVVAMQDDSIEGIYNTLKQCAQISKHAGGIGLSISNIRARGSYIQGTNGYTNGIVPMLRNFDMTARYVDQGGNKRKGAIAIYLEPWHADIFDFLDLKKNHGKEEKRARDLFYGLWIPDLFMKRVRENGMWSLFSPDETPELLLCYGNEFEERYHRYEQAGKARKTIPAQELWFAILDSQIETGTPYMLYKDAVNSKSNQKNIGVIQSSNLCAEILEYSSPDEISVCNLASIALPMFVVDDKTFDFERLYNITYTITCNLNKVIDVNYYPLPQAKYSNLKHRPIGIGVQGLADAFFKMHLVFDSHQARILNQEIFETIYFAALTASKDLAKKLGPYDSFSGSPISHGIFQFDMWNVKPTSGRWDWSKLRQDILQYGVRNSLLLSPMPTASTSQILGNSECFEPYTSNVYVRRVLSGEFIIVNRWLLKDLVRLGLWSEGLKEELILNNGSVQAIDSIPEGLKKLYRTVWEIPQKSLIDMAADRAPYICQGQSLNLYVKDPNPQKLSSMHFYAWSKGLKTGMYYMRTKPATDAIKFTIQKKEVSDTCMMCSA